MFERFNEQGAAGGRARAGRGALARPRSHRLRAHAARAAAARRRAGRAPRRPGRRAQTGRGDRRRGRARGAPGRCRSRRTPSACSSWRCARPRARWWAAPARAGAAGAPRRRDRDQGAARARRLGCALPARRSSGSRAGARRGGDEPGRCSDASRRVLETAARHAEDGAIGPEHLLLAPRARGARPHERRDRHSGRRHRAASGSPGCSKAPSRRRLRAPRRDIAALEVGAAPRGARGPRGGDAGRDPARTARGRTRRGRARGGRPRAAAARTRRFAVPRERWRLRPRRVPSRSERSRAGFSRRARSTSLATSRARRRSGSGTPPSAREHLLLGARAATSAGSAGRVLAGAAASASARPATGSSTSCRAKDDSRASRRARAGAAAVHAAHVAHRLRSRVREMSARGGATEVDTRRSPARRSSATAKASRCACSSSSARRAPRAAADARRAAGRRAEVPARRLTRARAVRSAWPTRRQRPSAMPGSAASTCCSPSCVRRAAADALAAVGVTDGSVLAGLVDLAGGSAAGERARTPRLLRSIETARSSPPRPGVRRRMRAISCSPSPVRAPASPAACSAPPRTRPPSAARSATAETARRTNFRGPGGVSLK